MTLAQLRTYCWDILDDPNGSYFTSSVLNLRLNLATRELQKRLITANKDYYSECVKANTVVNQREYSLPSDFYQLIRLEWYQVGTSLTSLPNKIEPISPNQRDLVNEIQGSPQFYSMAGNNILLWPLPDQVYEMHLEYAYQIVDMALDADEPDAPEQYHEYIAILATRDCLIKDGRPLSPIETKLNDYETLLKQLAVQRQADAARMGVVTRYDNGDVW